MLVVHLLVDTRDAMGANLVNGMCEGVAPLDRDDHGRRSVPAHPVEPHRPLARSRALQDSRRASSPARATRGEQARDGIIVAADFAARRPVPRRDAQQGHHERHRPVAIATGNDWRAIEAGAHAYAARGGRYSSLTNWWADERGQSLRPHRAADQGRHRRRAARVEPDRGAELALARRQVGDRARAGHGAPSVSRRTSRRSARSRPKASRRAT